MTYQGDSGAGLAYERIAFSWATGTEPPLLNSDDENIGRLSRIYHIATEDADRHVFPSQSRIGEYNAVILAFYIGKYRIPADVWMHQVAPAK